MRNVHISKDWVVLTVAIGLCTALNLITAAVLFYAFYNPSHTLSDNAVQLLTGWGGGMIGIVGAYVGYRASPASPHHTATFDEEEEAAADTPNLVDTDTTQKKTKPTTEAEG